MSCMSLSLDNVQWIVLVPRQQPRMVLQIRNHGVEPLAEHRDQLVENSLMACQLDARTHVFRQTLLEDLRRDFELLRVPVRPAVTVVEDDDSPDVVLQEPGGLDVLHEYFLPVRPAGPERRTCKDELVVGDPGEDAI